MMKNRCHLWFSILALLPTTDFSFAQINTLAIQGYVTSVDDGNNFLNGEVTVGDSITGTIVYDLSAQDDNSDPNIGDYFYDTTPAGIELHIGNYSFLSDP